MTFEFSNLYTYPFFCGLLGALIAEGLYLIKSLQNAWYNDDLNEIVDKFYILIRILRLVAFSLIGGTFVYFLSNSTVAPIWQLYIGATSVGFFEKILGFTLKLKENE